MRIADAEAMIQLVREIAKPHQRALLDAYLDGRLERWPQQFRHELSEKASAHLQNAAKLVRRQHGGGSRRTSVSTSGASMPIAAARRQ